VVVSKAQKGLHLNEDIYAGMNAFGRGGKIKRMEYYQCGKGRNLGFGTILNFQMKIGTGMGEQMLSHEYNYLGTHLPIDRFTLLRTCTWKAVWRLTKQFSSLSFIFEVFSTQIYTHSILTNLTFGGAHYIATGCGFTMTHIYFNILFFRFASPSIYLSMRTLIMLLYITLTPIDYVFFIPFVSLPF